MRTSSPSDDGTPRDELLHGAAGSRRADDATAAIHVLEAAGIQRAYQVVLDTLRDDKDETRGRYRDHHEYAYRVALHRLLLYVAENMNFERQPVAPSPFADAGPVRHTYNDWRNSGELDRAGTVSDVN